jgi:hypothetical protein
MNNSEVRFKVLKSVVSKESKHKGGKPLNGYCHGCSDEELGTAATSMSLGDQGKGSCLVDKLFDGI